MYSVLIVYSYNALGYISEDSSSLLNISCVSSSTTNQYQYKYQYQYQYWSDPSSSLFNEPEDFPMHIIIIYLSSGKMLSYSTINRS